MFEKIRERGIQLKRLNICMFIVGLLASIAMFAAMQITTSIYDETHEVTQNLSKWRTSAYDLQVGSDYLTDQIRCFVATGDKTYLDNYFTEVNVTKRREKALQEIQSHSEYVAALDNLRRAMSSSTELMTSEYTAAKLIGQAYGHDLSTFPEEVQTIVLSAAEKQMTDEQKKEHAIDLVFGPKYKAVKDTISSYMQKSMDSLSTGIQAKQAEMAQKLKLQVFFEHALTVILIIIMLGIIVMSSILIIRPVRKAIARIRNEEELPMEGAQEVRFLTKTYNLFYITNMKNRGEAAFIEKRDEMTGLLNQTGFEYLMKNADLETSALVLVHLNGYEDAKKKYSQEVIDTSFKEVAEEITGNTRAQNYVCRLEDDTIAVIVVHADHSFSSPIRKTVSDINHAMSLKVGAHPHFSICAGAVFGYKKIKADNMIKHAQDALENIKGIEEKDIRFYHEMMGELWLQ